MVGKTNIGSLSLSSVTYLKVNENYASAEKTIDYWYR